MKEIKIYTKKDMQELIKEALIQKDKEFYYKLNKLNERLSDVEIILQHMKKNE